LQAPSGIEFRLGFTIDEAFEIPPRRPDLTPSAPAPRRGQEGPPAQPSDEAATLARRRTITDPPGAEAVAAAPVAEAEAPGDR